MEKLKSLSKADAGTLILMGVSCVLITVTGIVFGQTLLRILPLYISLIIGLLQSRVNRFAPLLGGINSLLYAAVYLYYGLYASALYAVLVSCPLQLVTFANWSRRAYGQSVRFKRMSGKGRLHTTAAFVVCWLIMYVIMSKLGSSYMLFDNTVTLFGILITILTMFAYIEYTWLMIPSCLCSVGMYIAMLGENPEQVTYLIHAVYALICNCISFVHARQLWKEQNTETN
ncbi:MAG: nicotinamide mononucleotide transporter [Clostridia bacterium]|nr:nicotinamide mononucleotide transporter [Clostridia bacterium]